MFKGKLWKKLLITFLLVILVFFLVVNYPLKAWMRNRAEDSSILKLKTTANHCYEAYLGMVRNNENMSMNDYMGVLRTAEYYTGIRSWVVDGDGTVLADTYQEVEGKNIKESDPEYLSQTVLVKKHLSGIMNEDTLSYVQSVSSNQKTRGYIVHHMPYEQVVNQVDEMLFWANAAGILAGVMVLGILAFYGIYYTWVLNTLIKRTVSYTTDNYEKKGKIMRLKDEHQELANAIDCLAEKNEGLVQYQKNFVANISHDFRSPLTSIRGYTVALKDGTIPYEAQGKYLDIILFETDRLTGLTQNLLQLNEFDNNAISLDWRKMDICSLIKQSAQTFEAVCATKNIKMRLVFAEREINVLADKSKLQQVLHNLIDNAIKFSEKDGLITVTVSEKDDKAYVSVKDNGIGIPKSSINQIWERFYKTDLSRGKDKKGTGLGLSIVKQIINAHGEQIVVASKVGEGTEFTFSLAKTKS